MKARQGRLTAEDDPEVRPLRGDVDRGVAVSELLAKMDEYDWTSVQDIKIDEEERRASSRRFKRFIDDAGVDLDGSVLDLACGTNSLAYSHEDTVAVDNDPRKIKRLREDGIKAVLAGVEDLPFEEKSFDYVVSFSPPLQAVVHDKRGYVTFGVNQEWCKKIVDAALRIARREVLIASYFVALHPPREELVERRDSERYQWVLYRAGDSGEHPLDACRVEDSSGIAS